MVADDVVVGGCNRACVGSGAWLLTNKEQSQESLLANTEPRITHQRKKIPNGDDEAVVLRIR